MIQIVIGCMVYAIIWASFAVLELFVDCIHFIREELKSANENRRRA